MAKKKVAFICVHNSCRSQIAEAFGKYYADNIFESYSAGTEVKSQINQDAVRLMKKYYGIDMEKTQKSKLLTDIPKVDIVITMGCNVDCPFLPCDRIPGGGASHERLNRSSPVRVRDRIPHLGGLLSERK